MGRGMSKKKARPIHRATENRTSQVMREKRGTSQLNERMEEVLRAELSLLLEEGAKEIDLSIQPTVPELGQDPRYFIGLFEQKSEYILDRLEERLGLRRYWIRQYLFIIDERIRTLLAQAEEEGINPFTGESQGFSVIPYVNARFFLPKPEPKKLKKSERPKRGKRRKVEVNGNTYESIAAAARDNHKNGLGYGHIKHSTMKTLKDENKI